MTLVRELVLSWSNSERRILVEFGLDIILQSVLYPVRMVSSSLDLLMLTLSILLTHKFFKDNSFKNSIEVRSSYYSICTSI